MTAQCKDHIITVGQADGVTLYLSDATSHLDMISVSFKREKALPLTDEWAAGHAIRMLRALYPCLDWQATPVEG